MKLWKKTSVVFLSLIAVALLLSVGVTRSSAQVSAAISGRIEDSSGGAVPGANVTVTDLETGIARSTPADESGNYLVLSLPVGRYEIKADKAGFKTAVQTGVNLVVGQQAVVNLKLEVGATEEKVTVTADVPVVNTTTASISGLVGEQEVKNLPLNGRSYDNLITLNAGAINYSSYTAQTAVGGGPGNSFVVQGRRASENLFLLNGVEYSGESNRSIEPGGVSGQLLGIDAVREFNVLTDTYSAEYGKRPGAQVNVVTQSGSNQIHGTAFEFLRNSDLDARNFFDAPPSQIGHRIPEFQRNQFGGAVGGPIRKDKAFFFVNYEGFRQRLGISSVSVVPDDDVRLGLKDDGVTPFTTNIVPGMLPFFQLWPRVNSTLLGGGIGLSINSPKESIREDFATARMDQNLSSRDTLSEAYTADDGHSLTPQPDPVFNGVYIMRNQVLSIQEVHIFSPDKINTARVGYTRGDFSFNVPPAIPLPASLSFFAGLEPGSVKFGGTVGGLNTITAAGGTTDYQKGARNLETYSDDFQLIKGKHQITFGAWLQPLQVNREGASNKAGTASFSSLATFLQGTVSTFQGIPNPHEVGSRMIMGAWYVEDTIRLRSNLTLNAGLRHEFTNTLTGAGGIIGNMVLGPNGILETLPLVGQAFTQNHAKWMFGPRVGLAWDVFGNGKTSVRSGFGTYYSMVDYNLFQFDLTPPYNTLVALGSNVPFLPLLPIPVGTAGPAFCNTGVPTPCTTITPKGPLNNIPPTVEEYNLSIEQQIAPNTSLRVAYVGSHGYHEQGSVDYNSIVPQICAGPGNCVSGGLNKVTGLVTPGTLYVPVVAARPNSFLAGAGVLAPVSSSSYNGLEVDLKHRISRGLQFRANYTWSKNENITTDLTGTTAQNSNSQIMEPYNPRADWGPSSTDVTNAASISGIYELPIGRGKQLLGGATGPVDKLVGGWQVETIATFLSGLPFDTLISADQSGNGDTTNPDRPSWNPAFTGPVITGNPSQWYNPNAFIIPTSGTWGNVGKNVLRGPGLAEWDMSLLKNTSLTERVKLQFRSEFFNIVNHPNFGFPNQTAFSGGAINPSAGIITSTATTSRQIQFGLKFIY